MSAALPIALSAAVPLRIEELRRKGGPDDLDLDQARAFSTDLAERGDVLMYGGKKGEAAELFNKLAHALAVLAFAPGGVKVFGHHWEGHPPPRRRIRIIKAKDQERDDLSP